MDILHDNVADFVGADKTRLSHQMAIYYGLLLIGGWLMYFCFASMSFFHTFVLRGDRFFPHTIKRAHLKQQVLHEMWIAMSSLPFMAIVMLPAPLFLYRGYGKVYKNVDDYGWPYLCLSIVLFYLFTDCCVYWAHRGLHHPMLYKWLHKLHHTYKFTTPYSSHAFHPLDGFTQGLPYYIFVYLIPFHNVLFLFVFIAVNMWTISIHDQVDFGGHVVLTTGHHTIHHEDFNYNYGQFFSFWDRVGGTYKPSVQTHVFMQADDKKAH